MTQRAEEGRFEQAEDAPQTDGAGAEDHAARAYGAAQPDMGAADAAAGETAAPGVEQLLARERERADGYLAELQRERASFINYRRRADQEREQLGRDANGALIFNILPVLDDFERARNAIPEEQQGSP